MKKVKSHSFNGRKYSIVIGEFDGLTDKSETGYSLVVNCDINTRKGLISLIHEALHAGNWDKHEETIDRTSKEIGRLLWRLGYKIKNKKNKEKT